MISLSVVSNLKNDERTHVHRVDVESTRSHSDWYLLLSDSRVGQPHRPRMTSSRPGGAVPLPPCFLDNNMEKDLPPGKIHSSIPPMKKKREIKCWRYYSSGSRLAIMVPPSHHAPRKQRSRWPKGETEERQKQHQGTSSKQRYWLPSACTCPLRLGSKSSFTLKKCDIHSSSLNCVVIALIFSLSLSILFHYVFLKTV